MPVCFDILAQLANISARITIHELLRLLKETREALRDALANSKSFLMYMPEIPKDDAQSSCPECHHVQSKVPAITFTAEDMLLKDNKHDRPLYYTGYIDSTCIERVQVDPGSALSIIPQKAVKGQALAEFLAAHPVPEHSKLHEDIQIKSSSPM